MASVRRRPGPLAVLAAVVLIAAAYAQTSGGLSAPGGVRATLSRTHVQRSITALPVAVPPALQVTPRRAGGSWAVVAEVHGQPAALLAQRGGVTTARFDQHLVHLNLHAGSLDGGTSGWTYGNSVTALEANKLVAAFNGGFKLTYTNVGFMSGGRVAVPLKAGLASIVTYTDGTTDIRAWHAGVPGVGTDRLLRVAESTAAGRSRHRRVERFQLCHQLLGRYHRSGDERGAIRTRDHRDRTACVGRRRVSVTQRTCQRPRRVPVQCGRSSWTSTLSWVAGYLYAHHPRGLAPAPMALGQRGIEGKFLMPYSRDFLTVVAN